MRVISFNVNSIRVRLHQLQAVIDVYDPEIIGLQETKVADENFPIEEIRAMGYEPYFHGQKTHYGVALLSKKPLTQVIKGLPHDHDESQRRLILGKLALSEGRYLTVINGYFPQGENRKHTTKFPAKSEFYQGLTQYLETQCDPSESTFVIGDMNVAPLDLDIGIGETNRQRWLRDGKTSFLPEERDWLAKLMRWGLHDTYRHYHPETNDRFSWFDYRSRGFEQEPKRGLRIDLILASQDLLVQGVAADIDYDIRAMPKPSDHCPIIFEFTP